MILDRDIFDTVRDAVFVADIETGMIVDANHAAESLSGRSLEELRSMHHAQLHPPERAAEARVGFEKDTRIPGVTEGTVVDKHGRRIPVEIVSSQYIGHDGRQLLVGVFRDVAERKRAEEILRESEHLYRTLFDQSGDCLLLLRLDGCIPVIAGANEAALKTYGYSREEMVGKPLSLVEPEVREESLETRMRLVAEGKPMYMLHRRKDGSTFEVESLATLVKIGVQEVLLAVGRNISERKQAERALLRQNEFIQAALDNISDGVVACDDTGKLALFNRAAREWHGIDALRLPPDKWSSQYDLFGADGSTPLATDSIPLMRAFNGEHVRNAAMTIGAKGRPLRHVLVNGCPFCDEKGRKLGAVVAMHDVTERKQAEAALRQSENVFRAIGESIDYGVWVCAPDGRNTYASESFLKLVGLTQEECSNFGWGNVLHPDDAKQTVAAWKECVRSEGRWEREHRFRGVDGNWHPVLARGAPVRDERGQVSCWAGINLDISELKQTLEHLRASEAQARATAAELQAIMDAAPAVIVIAHDVEGRRVGGNRTANELLKQPSHSNLSSAAAYGERPQSFRLVRDGVELAEWERPLAKAASTGQALRNYEMQVVFRDGTAIDLLGNVEPLWDENGCPRGAVGVFSDITDRKRAEAALRESERRFRTVADSAPVMIWMSGLDKTCTFFNKGWLEFTGRTMEQEAGHGWVAGVHPEDRDRYFTIYSSSFEMRRSFQVEYRLRRADGEYRWLFDTGTPLYREGEFAGYISSCIDVTEQKTVQEQLRRSHAQLVDSQRLAHVGSWELDAATHRTQWSDEWYRIFGLPTDVRTDFETFLNCVHPKDRWIILEAQNKAFAMDGPYGVDFRIIRPDGEVRFIRSVLEAIKTDDGTLERLTGAAQDITDQVEATELLRQSEARLKTAERMSHVGHWDWNVQVNRASWSEEMFRIMGQLPDYEPRYEAFLKMVPSGDRDRLQAWVNEGLSKRQGGVIEYHVIRPDGDVRTVVCMAEVLLDEDGSPERMFGACQDVTDDRRAQAESFARQKLESLGTLANGIAHDFNNLLGAVLAQSELALAELATGSHPDTELKAIRDVAIRGSEIVRQLMVYAGKESEVLELVNVSKVVEEMLGLLKMTVSRHAALVTDLKEDIPAVQARAAQLSQIVMNLVVNASEAIGDRAGVIRVATERTLVGPAEAAATALCAGDYIRLIVSDSGRGMSPETQSKVFDPFFTTKFSGRGLGLAVVHGIVRSLHGTIEVASELGKGTTFQVLLPCAEPSAEPPAGADTHVEESVWPAERTVVLLVEDEEQLRLAVAKMLRRSGLEVFEADSGSAAIDLLRARGGEIDLILLDLTIPGNSSQEVLAEAARLRPDVKVLLTSAHSEEVARPMMRTSLVCGFIRKPFRAADLVQTLRGVLSS